MWREYYFLVFVFWFNLFQKGCVFWFNLFQKGWFKKVNNKIYLLLNNNFWFNLF